MTHATELEVCTKAELIAIILRLEEWAARLEQRVCPGRV
jgi:hypothetical protein